MVESKIDAINRAKAIINDVVEAMKHQGQIQSPSKLTRDLIGYNIGAGVAVGLKNSQGLVDEEANALLGSAVDSLTPGKFTAEETGATFTPSQSSSVVNNYTFNQPVYSPAETARAIRDAQITYGLAGA